MHAADILPDPNLDSAVSAALGKAPGTLQIEDLQRLTSLVAEGLQITNLEGLEWATNLAALYLCQNNIPDLSPLISLTQLSVLELEQNQVADLRPTAGLTNLTCLSLGANPITNYWVISNFTHLVSLSVRAGSMKSLAPVRNLKNLHSLVLWRNGIANVSPLAGLTNLSLLDLRWNRVSGSTSSNSWPTNISSLYLGGNSLSNAPSLQQLGTLSLLDLEDNWIGDVSPLTNLADLTYLSLSRNPITNLVVLTNLSAISSLELRGNALTDVSFLSALPSLTYVDLAYNRITNLSGLGNVESVVLAHNPVTDFTQFHSWNGLSNLWLFENNITNADFVTHLTALDYLNVESTSIKDLSPIAELTNLTGLAISHNPVTDYSALSGLTNLATLRLEGAALTNVDFLAGLSSLTFLDLGGNRLTTLAALNGLANLHDLYLKRNALTIITNLASLPALANIDVSYNSLNLGSPYPDPSGTNALPVIQTLQSRHTGTWSCECGGISELSNEDWTGPVKVVYSPTNSPPLISTTQHWFIPCNSTSALPIEVFEYPMPDTPLAVFASSSNPALASVVDGLLPGTNTQRTLSVFSGCDPANGTTIIYVGASDDVSLSNSVPIVVTVVPNLNVADLYTNADTNLLNAIAGESGRAVSELTVLDLLRTTSLGAENLSGGDNVVWAWLTNLTSLYLSGPMLTNMDFITNLTHLQTLDIDSSTVTNLQPLKTLPELSSLRIAFQPGLSVAYLSSGFSQLTSLDLTGDKLIEASFLTNLNHLVNLRLDDNYFTNIQAVASMTNLTFCSLEQNRLRDATPLGSLTNLAALDVRLNLLDLSEGSPGAVSLAHLTNTWLETDPQRQPPLITTPDRWFIADGSTSTVPIEVFDNAIYDAPLSLNATSSNPELISPQNLQLVLDTEGSWSLTCAPIPGLIGETIVTVTATNDAGLGSREAILVNVLVSAPVDVPDPALEHVILQGLNKSPPLTTVDMLDLTELDLTQVGVTNLAGLGTATNLTFLAVDNNQITDLTPLASLVQLTWLSASNNLISDVSPLQNLATLNCLNLASNPITNYSSFLVGFVAITNLDLSSTRMSELGMLTNLTQLSVLSLNCDQISDSSPLSGLSNLTRLSLSGNVLSDIWVLTNLVQLEQLDISSNQIFDISPLSALPQIGEVDLQRNFITNIAPLRALAGPCDIGLELNEVDLGADSTASGDLASLQESGFMITFLPQFPLDTDRDGMPDAWEASHGLNPNDAGDASNDLDGDGMPNLVEYALGTDPRNPTDGSLRTRQSFVSDGVTVYASLTFSRRNTPHRLQYIPEVSDDNLTWYSDSLHVQEIGHTAIDSELDSVTVINLTPAEQPGPRCLRLRILSN